MTTSPPRTGSQQPDPTATERDDAQPVLARRSLLAFAGAGIASLAAAGCSPLVPAKPAATTASATSAAPAKSATSTLTAPKVTTGAADGVASTGARTPSGSMPILRAQAVAAPGAAVTSLVGVDPVWHLLRRATFGPTPALVAEVRGKGIPAWLDEQLSPARLDDSACDAYLTRYPSLPMTTMQIRAAYPKYSWDAMAELGRATLARALWSRRQLFEVMVEFWSNHFNVVTPSAEVWDLKTVEDRDVIRRHALGKFSDLLQGSAKSPAMMRYLDNDISSVDTLNENYGRELLELHTVGLGAGYTQAEVVDSARLLTGYTVGRHGEFAYYNDWRYLGPVSVLGFSHPNADSFDGLHVAEAYLNHLAHHPATAANLATKLVRRFVADTPPPALVQSLASVYLANDTAIAPVLRALFTSNEFATSIGQKTKRPIEDVIGCFRTLGVTPAAGDSKSLSGIYWLLNGMGQAPLNWAPPNGFPDVTGAWLSTAGTLGRWYAHLGAVGGWWKDGMTTPAYAGLLGGATPADNGALIDLLAVRLLGVRLGDTQRNALLAFLTNSGTPKVADALKYRVDILATLVLDSPNWIQR